MRVYNELRLYLANTSVREGQRDSNSFEFQALQVHQPLELMHTSTLIILLELETGVMMLL